MVAPQFINVGADDESIDLASIQPTGDDLDDVNIQLLTAGGTTAATYTWNTYMFSDPCWIDDNYEVVSGVSFGAGQGLWIQGSSSAQSIQSCGKVGKSDVAVRLKAGATATGNPFPVSIDLADIYPTGDNLDDVNIQLLTAGGTTEITYTWNTYMFAEPCWIDDNYEAVTGVIFAPGQGLWVQGSSEAQYLNFPAPEL